MSSIIKESYIIMRFFKKIKNKLNGSLTVWDPSVTACVAESYVKFSGRKTIAHASRYRTSDGL